MKKKILLIDDDIVTLKILKGYLEEDYDVQMENAGYLFMQNPGKYYADMVLVDVHMPVADGVQIYEKVSGCETFKKTPFVFLVGSQNSDEVKRLSHIDARDYIVKTLPKEGFLSKVRSFLASADQKKKDTDVLVLNGDEKTVRLIHTTLVQNSYTVKVVRTMYEAYEYMSNHTVKILLLGTDLLGFDGRSIYDRMSDLLHEKGVQALMFEGDVFENELVERVNKALQ